MILHKTKEMVIGGCQIRTVRRVRETSHSMFSYYIYLYIYFCKYMFNFIKPCSRGIKVTLRLTLWPWSWNWHTIYVKCKYFMYQEG